MRQIQILILHFSFWFFFWLKNVLNAMSLCGPTVEITGFQDVIYSMYMSLVDVVNVIFFFYLGYFIALKLFSKRPIRYIFIGFWVLYVAINLLWLQKTSGPHNSNLLVIVGTLHAVGWCLFGLLGRIFFDWFRIKCTKK